MPETRTSTPTRHEVAQLVAADALHDGGAAFERWHKDIESTFGSVDTLLGHVSARWFTAFYASLDAELEMSSGDHEPNLALIWDRIADVHPGYRLLLELGSTRPVLTEGFAYQCDRVQATTGIDMRAALATRYPRLPEPVSASSTALPRRRFHTMTSADAIACRIRRIGRRLRPTHGSVRTSLHRAADEPIASHS